MTFLLISEEEQEEEQGEEPGEEPSSCHPQLRVPAQLKGKSSSHRPETLREQQQLRSSSSSSGVSMAAASKSSQTAKNAVIALLALWSVVSLIVIVVWATSPDLKSSAQCRAELQDATEKLEGGRVVWSKNKEALEELVLKERETVERQGGEMLQVLGRLNATNASLHGCWQDGVSS